MSEILPYVKMKVDEVKQEGLSELDLSECDYYKDGENLKTIPSAILELEQLDVLNLRNNSVTVIPEEICLLKNLKTLILIDNPIDIISDLTSLNPFVI